MPAWENLLETSSNLTVVYKPKLLLGSFQQNSDCIEMYVFGGFPGSAGGKEPTC